MILARVEGVVVATKKNAKMTGQRFLTVRPLIVDASGHELKPGSTTLVCTDTVGAGEGELVLVVQGSSARLSYEDKNLPVDAVIIGIVDSVDVGRERIYRTT